MAVVTDDGFPRVSTWCSSQTSRAHAAMPDRHELRGAVGFLRVTGSLVVLGGGGCAREVLDVVDAINDVEPTWAVAGVLDDGVPDVDRLSAFGVGHLGPIDLAAELVGTSAVVFGIGEPRVRARIAPGLQGLDHPTLVHPSVVLSRRQVELHGGVVLCAHVSVQNHVTVESHVHVNQNVTIGHDVRIGSGTVVSPLVAISGNVHIGEAVLIGAGAAILPGVRIGARARVGAGAVVTRDVAAGDTVVGAPARPIQVTG